MRIVLFCENKYAISILTPIQDARPKKRKSGYILVCTR